METENFAETNGRPHAREPFASLSYAHAVEPTKEVPRDVSHQRDRRFFP